VPVHEKILIMPAERLSFSDDATKIITVDSLSCCLCEKGGKNGFSAEKISGNS
jgi:hypothetical protein